MLCLLLNIVDVLFIVRSLGVWAGTISLIGVNEEPPAAPVGSCFLVFRFYQLAFTLGINLPIRAFCTTGSFFCGRDNWRFRTVTSVTVIIRKEPRSTNAISTHFAMFFVINHLDFIYVITCGAKHIIVRGL